MPDLFRDLGHLRFFTRATGRRLIKDAGRRLCHVYVTPMPIGYAVEPRLPWWLTQLMERLYYGLTVCWKTLFA